ncbi:MAG: GldG family protein [Bacteroidota bacterium]
MKSKRTIQYAVILITGIVILINILANRFFFRLDLTEDKQYTLSEATRDILRSLEEPVTITAYFSKKLPPDYANLRRDFKDMLTEYKNISKGMVAYEFIDPLDDPAIEDKARQQGILEAQIPGREKDEFKIQKAYMGAVIQMGDQSEIIPIIQNARGMEYTLTSNIKKLSVIDKPLIGFLQGHGETRLYDLQAVNQALNVMYQVEEVRLTDTTRALEKYEAVAIIAPVDSFPENHLQQIEDFLAQGKGLVVALNRVDANFNETQYVTPNNTGFETWLEEKGVVVKENLLFDKNANIVGLQMQQGPFSVQRQIQFFYYPVITSFIEHPVVSGLEQVSMELASTIEFTGDSAITFTPVAFSSEHAGTTPVPASIDFLREWNESDFTLSNLPVAAILEGKIAGGVNSRMVVFGDGSFPAVGPQQQQIPFTPDEVSLLANAVDWLADDTGLIELRTKGATSRPLDELEDAQRTFLKYTNFFLPIVMVIIFGILRMQYRQNLRTKRMEEDYV